MTDEEVQRIVAAVSRAGLPAVIRISQACKTAQRLHRIRGHYQLGDYILVGPSGANAYFGWIQGIDYDRGLLAVVLTRKRSPLAANTLGPKIVTVDPLDAIPATPDDLTPCIPQGAEGMALLMRDDSVQATARPITYFDLRRAEFMIRGIQ